VHLKVVSEWKQKPIYDVIAKIRGSQQPDSWVIRGNHHDAWVFGAADPFSGHVALMAEAKSIGTLVKEGWRPRRTLVYASWDGEEPGLLGSTEWVETHAAELKAKAVLYVNSDMNGRGVFEAEGSHALQSMVNEVTSAVSDPETGTPVRTRALAARRVMAYEAGHAADAESELTLGALGSGSDYTPFLQHLGIASLNVEFRGEGDYGVYHSAYDSFDHFRRFVDPTFQYEVTLAEVAGRIVLRAADADLLPSQQVDFAKSVAGYDTELQKFVESLRAKSRELGQLLDEGAYGEAADPLMPRTPPPRPAEVPFLSFAQLDNAIQRLQSSAAAFDKEYQRVASAADGHSKTERARMNAALANLEGTLTVARGLPGRAWYQHMIYAPGLHTGYGVKTLPGVREAIEDGRWDEANEYMGVVAQALNAYSAQLDRALAPL
jgi:N-acetylated-alpha-linked acidic dipeptidase